MASLKDTLAQLPTAKVEVIGTDASQRPTLEAITLGLGLGETSVTPITHTSGGIQYSCGDIQHACDCNDCSGSCCCHDCFRVDNP